MSSKLPAIQFYVGDWLRDPIAGCSLEAQGLWLRMMIMMHDSESYGRLEAGGKALDERQIARTCGIDVRVFRRLLKELLNNSVPSIDEVGVIYSRRMVRDSDKRELDRNRKREQRRNKQGEYHNAAESCPAAVLPLSRTSVPDLSHRSSTSTSTSSSSSRVVTPDIETVLAKASMIGCKPEWADKFFDHYDSQGWMKPNGLKITNWQTLLKRWAETNRAEQSTGKGRGTGGSASSNAYALDIKAKAFEEEKGKLERHRAEVAGGDFLWDDPKAKTRWFEVRKELASIAKEKQRI